VCARAELDPANRNAITNPVVLVEVLSPGTVDYDRGEKLAQYKRIPSLREGVLVAHDESLLEVWRREQDAWTRTEVRSGSVRLASIDCTLDVADVYRDELAPD
jgi:Uma2 family endonuclease